MAGSKPTDRSCAVIRKGVKGERIRASRDGELG